MSASKVDGSGAPQSSNGLVSSLKDFDAVTRIIGPEDRGVRNGPMPGIKLVVCDDHYEVRKMDGVWYFMKETRIADSVERSETLLSKHAERDEAILAMESYTAKIQGGMLTRLMRRCAGGAFVQRNLNVSDAGIAYLPQIKPAPRWHDRILSIDDILPAIH